jgi:hypothetical protein
MKRRLIPRGLAVVLALFATGCETSGVSGRAQEKSAVYATLRPWQKRLIDKGTISPSFTPDMVYIAMGRPDKVETKEYPQGHVELWTYGRYYPDVDAVHGFRHAEFTTESAYQPQIARTQTMSGMDPNDPFGRFQVPLGMENGLKETLFKRAGGQGGTIEPADLRSYTIKVLFAGSKVVQIGADENP